MFVLALSLYNTWNRGVFLLCKITNLLIYSFKTIAVVLKHENTYKDTNSEANQISEKSKEDLEQIKKVSN